MRSLDPSALDATSACAAVATSSACAPEFLLGENGGSSLFAARWRRRRVCLAEPTRLNDHLLSYCAEGTAACTIVASGVRRDHLQQPGTLTFLQAGELVQWSLDAASDVVHVHLYISKEAVARIRAADAAVQRTPLANFIAVRDAWLEGYFSLLLNEYELYGRNDRLADSVFLDQTEALLVRKMLLHPPAEVPSASNASARRINPLRPTLLGRINGYLLQNLAREIRLPQLAALAAVSVDHFVRAFREATGMTPHRYITELRLNHARDLLRSESTPVADIARCCGFGNAAHFSVAFRERYGLTPSEYRRRH